MQSCNTWWDVDVTDASLTSEYFCENDNIDRRSGASVGSILDLVMCEASAC